MQPTIKPSHLSAAFALLAATVLLQACGGGSDATPTSTPTSSILTLQGSGGDLAKYANTIWLSDCGLVPPPVGSGGTSTSRGIVLRFGTPVGTTLPGTVDVTNYAATNCQGTTLPDSVGQVAVTYSYVKTLAVTSAVPPSAQGTADELLLQETVSRATQTFVVGFEPGWTHFRGNASSVFISATLRYNKL